MKIVLPIIASSLCLSTLSAQVGGQLTSYFQDHGASSQDNLGIAVSGIGDLDGDGIGDFMYGADFAQPGGVLDAGSVFIRSGATGALLFQFDGGPNDRLGGSLGELGDVNGDGVPDILMGSSHATVAGIQQSGAALVYSGADGSLIRQFDSGLAADHFGAVVAGAGDVNADGHADIIVGAKAFAAAGSSGAHGAAFVYSGIDGALLYRFDGIGLLDEFGAAVAGAGDVNADGYADLIIGAPRAFSNGIPQAGSVYVYSGADGSLLHEYGGGSIFEFLGWAVTGVGDVDHDGSDDFLFGSPGVTTQGQGLTGAAFLCSGASGALMQRFDGEEDGDSFAFSMTSAGDFDADGTADLLIGAITACPDDQLYAGSAYVYSGSDGTLLRRFDGEQANAQLGAALASVGDLNQDGRSEIILGIPFASPGGSPFAGSVEVLGFHPLLTSSARTVSVATGGQIDLELDFPIAAANFGHKLLISTNGPGVIDNHGVVIPLQMDFMVERTYNGWYPFSNYSNLQGNLDANAHATASIGFAPAQLDPSLVGRSLWMAAAASHSGLKPAEFSSVAIQVTIEP